MNPDAPYGGTIPPQTTTTEAAPATTATTAEVRETPGLAFTGGDVAGTFVLGGLAVTIGALLIAGRRYADRHLAGRTPGSVRP